MFSVLIELLLVLGFVLNPAETYLSLRETQALGR